MSVTAATMEALSGLNVPEWTPAFRDSERLRAATSGWYAPREVAITADRVWHSEPLTEHVPAVLFVAEARDGFMSGYLRIAQAAASVLSSEVGEVHVSHFVNPTIVGLVDVTFGDAVDAREMTDADFDVWFEKHRKGEQ